MHVNVKFQGGYLQGEWVSQLLIFKRKKLDFFLKINKNIVNYPLVTWHDFF